MKIKLYIIIHIFFFAQFVGCTSNEESTNKKSENPNTEFNLINKIVSEFDSINYQINIRSFSLENDTLRMSLNVYNPPIIDSSHIGFLLTYCSRELSNRINYVKYEVDVLNQKDNTTTIRNYIFKKENLLHIKSKFMDYGYKKLIKSTLKNLNEFEAPILNLYINRIQEDFPDTKMDLEIFDLISEFHNECLRLPRGDFGKAGRTILLIYSLDKDLDMLKNNSAISTKLKTIWMSSVLSDDIDTSLNLLLK